MNTKFNFSKVKAGEYIATVANSKRMNLIEIKKVGYKWVVYYSLGKSEFATLKEAKQDIFEYAEACDFVDGIEQTEESVQAEAEQATAETAQDAEPEQTEQQNNENGTILDKSNWDGKTARLQAVVKFFKSHNMHYEANKAYKYNWKFYREHTPPECIQIIMEECRQAESEILANDMDAPMNIPRPPPMKNICQRFTEKR